MIAMAKRLNDYREERYMDVRDFVEFLGITNTTYYKIIKGERPRFTTMHRIAEKLGVHPSDIEEFLPPRDYEWIKPRLSTGRLVRWHGSPQVWFESRVLAGFVSGGMTQHYVGLVPVASAAVQRLIEDGTIKASDIIEVDDEEG